MITSNKTLKITGVTITIMVIVGYSLYQTRNLIKGPVLSVSSPANGITLNKPLVEIKGYVKNASYITLNDRQIFVNEQDKFNEKLLLSPGYNIIEIKIKDRFDRTKTEKLEVVYLPEETSTN